MDDDDTANLIDWGWDSVAHRSFWFEKIILFWPFWSEKSETFVENYFFWPFVKWRIGNLSRERASDEIHRVSPSFIGDRGSQSSCSAPRDLSSYYSSAVGISLPNFAFLGTWNNCEVCSWRLGVITRNWSCALNLRAFTFYCTCQEFLGGTPFFLRWEASSTTGIWDALSFHLYAFLGLEETRVPENSALLGLGVVAQEKLLDFETLSHCASSTIGTTRGGEDDSELSLLVDWM